MRTAILTCALALLTAAVSSTADSAAQQLFNRLQTKTRDDILKVPRYTCVETITRRQFNPQYGARLSSCESVVAARDRLSSPGLLVWHDRLRLDVAVGENSEMFSWAGARQFETGDLRELTLSGSSGSGDFSAFLAGIFGGDAGNFRYNGLQETPLGRLAAFGYTVTAAKSHYSYQTDGGAKGVAGYGGTIYADPATAELKRLVVEATDFASGEVCRVLDTMDYRRVKIGTGDFPLPQVSGMKVLYRNGTESDNETHYSDCHEFTGESSIRFDTDTDEQSSAVAEAAKQSVKSLPAKAKVHVKIDPPLDTATAAAGDAITGLVEREEKDKKGEVVFRTSDRLHGRVLRLEQFTGPVPYWVVAIRFESIERDGVERKAMFAPLDDGNRLPPSPARMRIAVPPRPPGAGIFILPGIGNLMLDQKFHTAWETR